MSKIDFTKPVQIKDGRKVRILCTDGPDENYPIVGIIDRWIDTEKWNKDGSFCNGEDSRYDLVNAPEGKRTVDFWVNVWDDGELSFNYSCKAEADLCAGKRLACLHIVREYEVGEGLDK